MSTKHSCRAPATVRGSRHGSTGHVACLTASSYEFAPIADVGYYPLISAQDVVGSSLSIVVLTTLTLPSTPRRRPKHPGHQCADVCGCGGAGAGREVAPERF